MKEQRGKGLDNLLKEIEYHINRTPILVNRDMSINIKRTGNSMLWDITFKTKDNPNGKNIKGKKIEVFKQKLNQIYKETNDAYVPCVICLQKVVNNIATYLIIDPLDPYHIVGNTMKFETLDISVNDAEAERVKETGLGFYDFKHVYPLTTIAKESVGKLMDAIASFKSNVEIPMGPAMLIAEKIGDMKAIDLLYEDYGGNIRPVLGVCSNKYGGYTQKEYFEKMIQRIQKEFFFDSKMCNWHIFQAGYSILDIPISGFSTMGLDYEPIIRLSSSDLPGLSNKAELIAKVGKGEVLLLSKSKYHNNKDVEEMIDGFKEEIHNFNNYLSQKVIFDEKDYKDIQKIIGKSIVIDVNPKNGKKIRKEIDFQFKNKEVYLKDFINDTWKILPPKQQQQLRVFYNDKIKNKVTLLSIEEKVV